MCPECVRRDARTDRHRDAARDGITSAWRGARGEPCVTATRTAGGAATAATITKTCATYQVSPLNSVDADIMSR